MSSMELVNTCLRRRGYVCQSGGGSPLGGGEKGHLSKVRLVAFKAVHYLSFCMVIFAICGFSLI